MPDDDKPTALATRETPIKPPLVAGGRSMAIVPQDIEQAFRLAQAIAAADMAPKAYNRDANRIMVGIMHGLEVGLTPMAALQSIAVVNGMPTLWGDGMLALVRGSGLLEWMEETVEGKGAARVAVCRTKRKGEPQPATRTFSWQQVVLAGLDRKPGPWSQYPDRMLSMRARSIALRDGFADVLRGLATPDDMGETVTLGADAEGTYVPRPTRAEYAEAEAVAPDLDRQYRATMGEVVDTDTGEITETAEDADGLPVAPEAQGPAAGPEPHPAAAPTLIPCHAGSDGKIDWQSWLADARAAVDSAPSADWIGEWRQLHTATLASLKAKSPNTHTAFIAFLNGARLALGAATG